MTVSNLARTIGITVVGYSSSDPSTEEILSAVRSLNHFELYSQLSIAFQTQYQTATTEKLIQIDSDYWSTFISGNQGEDLYR